MKARIIIMAMAHIGYIRQNGLAQFICDAYLYAEEYLDAETYFELLDKILDQQDVDDEVLTNYVIDVMTNKAQPIKVKMIEGGQ